MLCYIVQRHGDIGVAHDVLQRFGIHTGVCHTGAERVSEGVRGDVTQSHAGIRRDMRTTLPHGKWRKRLKIRALPPFAELHKVG